MDAVCVLNIGNFLPAKCRESFQAAAERWQVEYVEITEPLGKCHHFWQKAIIPLSCHAARFERVLQLDADMLVADDCPSPFAIVPKNAFGVVSRVQPYRPELSFQVQRWASHYKVTGYRDPREHINAGFMLYNPNAHADLLRCWQDRAEPGPERPRCSLPEQFVISCLLAERTVPVYWLSWMFNACRQNNGAVPRNCYIAHFHAPRHRPLSVIADNFTFERMRQFA